MGAAAIRQSEADAARAFLADHGQLARTPADFRAGLLALATFRRFAPGEDIISADTNDAHICALVRGAAGFMTALGPADTRINHMLQPGDWFGYGPLFTGERRNGTVTARSQCLVAVVPRAGVERLFDAHPGWWKHMGLVTLHYGNTGAGIVADLMIPDSRRRCLATLLRLAGCRSTTAATSPVAYINQEELGALANLRRSSVNRMLRAEEERGYLTLGYNRITLHDPDALRAIADEL